MVWSPLAHLGNTHHQKSGGHYAYHPANIANIAVNPAVDPKQKFSPPQVECDFVVLITIMVLYCSKPHCEKVREKKTPFSSRIPSTCRIRLALTSAAVQMHESTVVQ